MQYLFFDIECCDGEHICEFGYVITDTNFNILKKEIILINPEAEFNLIGRKNQKDLYLYFSEEEYYNSEIFPVYHSFIKELIETPNQIVVGHAIINDADFLRTACKRYNLNSINFNFADSQKMYSELLAINRRESLENAGKMFHIEEPEFIHRSDEDSETTMKLVHNMCTKMECSLVELIEMCDTCTGKSIDFDNYYDFQKRSKRDPYELLKNENDNRMVHGKYRAFLRYTNRIKPINIINDEYLSGKIVSISINYECNHFREMLCIAQLLVNHNAKYGPRASDSDIFVSYDLLDENGNKICCSRMKYVNDAIKEGKNIDIISIDELLKMLNINEEELLSFPFPKRELFFDQKKKKHRVVRNNYRRDRSNYYTIGEVCKDFFNEQDEE